MFNGEKETAFIAPQNRITICTYHHQSLEAVFGRSLAVTSLGILT